MVVRTLVPRPSFASTEPLVKLDLAVPAPIDLKVIVIILPALPVYPEGNPPLKLIVPAEFEKVGSVTHKLKIEPDRLTETTDNSFGLNEIEPSAAFIGFPDVFTVTLTVKVEPEVYTPVFGESDKVAASVLVAESPNKNRKITKKTSDFFVLDSRLDDVCMNKNLCLLIIVSFIII
jgi:hypothetical protein